MNPSDLMPSAKASMSSDLNYYQDTSKICLDGLPQLKASKVADVCIIGGGITGSSAALQLAQRGYSVALLEANTIGYGASGRSGGQIITGLSAEMEQVEKEVGLDTARHIWNMTLEAIDLVKDYVSQFAIPCDYRRGYLLAANKPRHAKHLQRHIEYMSTHYGYDALEWLDKQALGMRLVTNAYEGGIRDPHSGQLHPLNYTCGLAKAAIAAGAELYIKSPVTHIAQQDSTQQVTVTTRTGTTVTAKFVIQATNAYFSGVLPRLDACLMRVPSYIAATRPLAPQEVASTIPGRDAICDTNFMLDYFRLSSDNRLLLGGRQSIAGCQQRIKSLFPVLGDIDLTHYWKGYVAVTRSHTPMFGRIGNNIYYAQGYCGHGMALAGLAGKLLAETIAGQSERFDVFTRFDTRRFPVGHSMHGPLLELAKCWYRLRDLL